MKTSRLLSSITALGLTALLTGHAGAQSFSRDLRFSPQVQSEEPKRPGLRKKLGELKDQIERKSEETPEPAPDRPQTKTVPQPQPQPRREPISTPSKSVPTAETKTEQLPDASAMIARLRGGSAEPRVTSAPPAMTAAPPAMTAAPPAMKAPPQASGSPSARIASAPPVTSAPTISSSGVTILERKSRVAAEAMPQGYLPPQGSPPVMYSKAARNPAEGISGNSGQSIPQAAQMKMVRNPAEGTADDPSQPQVTSKSNGTGPQGLPSDNLANGGTYFPPGGGSGGYSAAPGNLAYGQRGLPTEISYKVDANSQLSTSAVKFLKGSIELADQDSYQYLVNLASALQSPELANFRFVVEGHASAEGADYANFLLSQRRANAIFGFLTSRGVSSQRLLSVGHGETFARFQDYEPDYLRAEDRQVVVFKLAE